MSGGIQGEFDDKYMWSSTIVGSTGSVQNLIYRLFHDGFKDFD